MSDNAELILPEGVELRADIIYGTGGGRELKADLYLPARGGGAHRPAVVYAHGGAWIGGGKNQFARHAAAMAGRGFVGLCVEYRLSDEAAYPAAIEDVKCAVRYLRAAAEELGVDPDRVGSAGGSAGGHLALLAAATPGDLTLEGQGGHGDQSSAVQAAVGFNPALDLVELASAESVQKFMGGTMDELGREAYTKASPLWRIGEGLPPILLLHGDADRAIPYEQSVRFRRAAEQAGGHVELFTAPGAEHAFFNKPPWFEPTLQRMIQFFTAHL